MSAGKKHICPVQWAGWLDHRMRRWLQNPQKILGPYIKEGMTVLDFGCGPGFFSIDMAQMAGKSGGVIASDLQEGMLQRVRDKIDGTEFQTAIRLHQCQENRTGLSEEVDFILLFYIVHEIPHPGEFFKEMGSILTPNGRILMAEPPVHVSKKAFEETIQEAENAGFMAVERPKIFFSRAALLKKR